MPTARNSLGRDARVIYVDEDGATMRMNVTQWMAQQQTTDVESQPLDGDYLSDTIPRNWTGSFTVDRDEARIDDYFARREADFFAGGRLRTGTVYAYISEPDGSTSGWQFSRASLKYADAGAWEGDAKVVQKIDFSASRRTRV